MRSNGRRPDQIRDITITRGFTEAAPGSVLIQAGRTMVLCTATIEDGVPPFLMNTNKGWVTAEYAMLPGSTGQRKARDGRKSAPDGRSVEIGRLLGRTMRAACHLNRIPGRTVWIDCDVLQADGGTRTVAISGAMVAFQDAMQEAEKRGWVRGNPVASRIAAISAGIVNGEVLVDLEYREDSRAEVDMNVVMNDRGEFIELQSSAERAAFTPEQHQEMLDVSWKAIQEIFRLQEQALSAASGA